MTLETAKISLEHYEKDGAPTGGFLRAVLENNLLGALRQGDEDSIKNLREIAFWVWDNLPANIWGNPQRVQEHLKAKQEKAA